MTNIKDIDSNSAIIVACGENFDESTFIKGPFSNTYPFIAAFDVYSA